jgi:hypothetical protein
MKLPLANAAKGLVRVLPLAVQSLFKLHNLNKLNSKTLLQQNKPKKQNQKPRSIRGFFMPWKII